MSTARTYTLEALTDIWTGDASGKGERLISTGLLGSIRWWFEVLVRGLGGNVCDPTAEGNRCPDSRKAPNEGHHCVVCELFGCTDWARKFRFQVLDQNDNVKQDQIKKGQTFQLSLTPLRPIRPEEWTLLDVTLQLVADYGAIGGKTVYKPTEETSRQSEQHHQDLGLVKLVSSTPGRQFQEDELRRYVSLPEWRKLKQGDFAWASLQHFWCVSGKHLSREDADHSSFNRVLGRHESKKCRDCGKVQDPRKWLAGGRAESKKVFSFKDPVTARRTFGFVQAQDNLDEMKQRLREKAWKDLKDLEFVAGAEVLKRLLGQGGAA